MRTGFLIVIAFCLAGNTRAQSVLQLRNMYYRAAVNSQSADSLYQILSAVNEKSLPLYQGYKGMAAIMVCSHSLNPYNKIKYFNEGKECLDNAIQLAPDNVELRYLRFSVQTSAPAFLGYKMNINADKSIILCKLNNVVFKKSDPDIVSRMVKYLLETNSITAEEKVKIKNYGND